jgi:plasmid stabilization system protein ParE
LPGRSARRRLEWSSRADRDYFDAWAYIAQDNVEAADGVARRIRDAGEWLIAYPFIGRKGQRPGTRERVVANTPFTIVYRVHPKVIRIGRILHQSRRYP